MYLYFWLHTLEIDSKSGKSVHSNSSRVLSAPDGQTNSIYKFELKKDLGLLKYTCYNISVALGIEKKKYNTSTKFQITYKTPATGNKNIKINFNV